MTNSSSQALSNASAENAYSAPETLIESLRRNPRYGVTIAPKFVAAVMRQVPNLEVYRTAGGHAAVTYPLAHGSVLANIRLSLGEREVVLEYNLVNEVLEADEMFSNETPTELTSIISDAFTSLMTIS